jgi:hypothetical protein
MGKTYVILLVSSILGMSSYATAGVGSSGGGKGVLCGGNLRVLDLYEAEEIYHLPSGTIYESLDASLKDYGVKAGAYQDAATINPNDPTLQATVLASVQSEFFNLISDVPVGTSIPPTTDATLPSIPSSCNFVQIILYDDSTNVIHRNPTLWSNLSIRDQTALILHELIYKEGREDFGATTSDDVRRLVGVLMSATPPDPMYEGYFNNKVLSCVFAKYGQNDPSSQLDMYDDTVNGVKGITLQAMTLHGDYNWGKTHFFIPNISTDSIAVNELPVDLPEFQGTMTEEIYQRSWNVSIHKASDGSIHFLSQSQIDGSSLFDETAIPICAFE